MIFNEEAELLQSRAAMALGGEVLVAKQLRAVLSVYLNERLFAQLFNQPLYT